MNHAIYDDRNDMIARNLKKIDEVVSKLNEHGIVVVEAKLNVYQPRITVEFSPACNRIHSVTQSQKYEAGKKWLGKVSVLNSCMVRWWEPQEATA